MAKLFLVIIVVSTTLFAQTNEKLQQLGSEFFAWRVKSRPITGDDVNRMERSDGWVPDYSPSAVGRYREAYKNFKAKLNGLSKTGWTRADSIDYLLLRSAIERIHWELDILDLPECHPEFYVQQTVGTIFDLLIIDSPWTRERADNLLLRFRAIPKTIDDAETNLTKPILPFASIAVGELQGIRNKLHQSFTALQSKYPGLWNPAFHAAVDSAATALEQYSSWLAARLPSMDKKFSVGRENYVYFLKNIALVPYSPETILAMGRQEWNRAVAFETYEKIKNQGLPELKMFPSSAAQIRQGRIDEEAIRKYVQEKHIFTIPAWTQHYTLRTIPASLKPLEDFGETDDFTSPMRMDEDGVRYIPEPSNDLSYFSRSAALDPRPLTVHEGMPGHYFQLVQSWHNSDAIRRHYFDSNSIEGIGFYLEEMLLQCGLFDDSPRTREIIYSYMRLRALRVDADVNLALGNYTIEQAARYLQSTVPMDSADASGEASFFALGPGQAITYQTGKLQILKLISDARIQFGDAFNLQDYHDYMMKNGNVPIALQRWEYTGKTDEIKALWQ